jgi:Fe-S cluster biogenesis protein NfuA
MFIQTQATTTPECMKFLPGCAVLLSGTADFPNAGSSDRSPLAQAMFEVDGVSGVYLDSTSITLTKAGGRDWAELTPAALVAIMGHFQSGKPVVDDGFQTIPESGLDSENGKAIQRLLDEHINPQVASHGGHIALVDVLDGTAYIRMGGGCQGCSMANVTLKQGVAKAIQSQLPEITNILDVTDHADGTNPYYQPGKGGTSAL